MGGAVARVGPVVPVGWAVRVATGDGAARPIRVAPVARAMRVDSVAPVARAMRVDSVAPVARAMLVDSVAPVVPVARTVLETPAVRDVGGDTSAA
jgi:hypothetical protein